MTPGPAVIALAQQRAQDRQRDMLATTAGIFWDTPINGRMLERTGLK